MGLRLTGNDPIVIPKNPPPVADTKPVEPKSPVQNTENTAPPTTPRPALPTQDTDQTQAVKPADFAPTAESIGFPPVSSAAPAAQPAAQPAPQPAVDPRVAFASAMQSSGLSPAQQKELLAQMAKGTPQQAEALKNSIINRSPAEVKSFATQFLALSAPEKKVALNVAGLLRQTPAPADLRDQLRAQVAKLPAGANQGMAMGRAINALGLYLPTLKPDSPGSEDATARLRTSYMSYNPNDSADEPQRAYARDMIGLARKESFQMVLQVPKGTDQAALKTQLMTETGISDPQEFGRLVRFEETDHAGYVWGEDNKWVDNDNKTIRIPARGPDVNRALSDARGFTDADIGLKPGDPGYATEGSHAASNITGESSVWQGQVNRTTEQENAAELAAAPGMQVHHNRTYNEGGNMLSGTLPNGQPYAVVGRDGLLTSTFLLERQFKAKPGDVPEFAPANVAARRNSLGLNKPNPAQQTEIAQTLQRLQRSNPAATEDDAKSFLAKMDITKDVMSQDIGVPRANLAIVSQPDFHLDMHMRPLSPGKLMINDFNETLRFLESAKKRATPGSWEDKEIDSMIASTRKKVTALQPVMDEIANQLKGAGLEVVRAPGVMDGRMGNLDRRYVNFMNAVPGTSQGSNSQFYATNYTSLKPLRDEFEAYMRSQGVERVEWIGAAGGGPDSKSASERSLDLEGGLDCRENHAFLQTTVPITQQYA